MAVLLAGLALFLIIHMAQWVPGFRAGMVARIGLGPWKGLYSLASLAGLALIIFGYMQARPVAPFFYEPPVWLKHISLLLVPIALILLVAAYAPTGRIKQAVKHPMLAAIKLWAFAHLLANGDGASVALFGAFLAWAVGDRISVARREKAGLAEPPVAGKNAALGDAIAVAGGLALSAALILWLHPILFGVRVLPG